MYTTKILDMRTYTYVVEKGSISNDSDAFILIDRGGYSNVITSEVFTDLLNMFRVYGIERYDDATIFADRVDELLHFQVIDDNTCRFIDAVLSLVRNTRLFEVMPPRNDVVVPSTAREFESSEIFISTRYTRDTVSDVSEDDFEPPSMDELIQLLQACA